MNKILIKSTLKTIISREKKGRQVLYCTEGGQLTATQIKKEKVLIQCNECNQFSEAWFYKNLWDRNYVCQSCVKRGSKNPFYGKKHSEGFKQALSKERSISYKGKNNPFYNKKHSKKTRKKLSEIQHLKIGPLNAFYGKHHSDKTKKILSQKCKKWNLAHPDICRRNALKGIKKQLGRKSSIERITEDKLIQHGFQFKYNFILNHKYQFDFLIEQSFILEVHGDYWHANPKKYGKGKRPINKTQRFKIKRDKEKQAYAQQLGYKIFVIWENQVRIGDFNILAEIK